MDRRQFSRNVLQEELGFTPQQLDYLFALPGKKVFEVIFATFDFFEQCVDRFNKKRVNNPRLENISIVPLSERDGKSVTVIMYSENVSLQDVLTWLSMRCTVQRGLELRDEDGIRTGAHRYYVKLRRDTRNGLLQHLPSTIQLGRIRGNVFYQGQPKTCRKCGSLGHLAAACNSTYCKNCATANHSTRDCDQPVRCNLCGASTHTYRTCPRSYANRTAGQTDADPRTDLEEDHATAPEPDLATLSEHFPDLNPVLNPEPVTEPNPVPAPVPAPAPDNGPIPPENDLNQPPTASPRPLTLGEDHALSAGAGTSTPAAEPTTEHPVEDNLPALSGILDWSDTPAGDEDDMEEEDSSNDIQLDLPQRLANSTAVSASDCRDFLDTLMADMPKIASACANIGRPEEGVDSPQTTPHLPDSSTEDSVVLDTQVWPSPSSTTASFLDALSLSAFSTATQMKVAEGECQKNKKRRKKHKMEQRPAPPRLAPPN